LKLLSNKKNVIDKKSTNKEIKNKEIIRKKILNKKVIGAIAIFIIIILGFATYKFELSKKSKTESNVNYTILNKTNISTTISSSGAIKSGDSTNIYSNLEYNIASINVEIGDEVKKGDVLATIDTATLQEQIAESEQTLAANETKNKLSLVNAKQKYDNLQYLYDNKLNMDIINAEEALALAKLNFEQEIKVYEYDELMLQNGQISQNEMDKEKINYEASKSAYDKATVALEAVKVNVDQSLAEAKNSYNMAQAIVDDNSNRLALEDKKKKLQDAKVIATVDGTVTNVNAVVGTQASGALFVIQDLNNLIVNASVDETDVANVEVGQRVEITTDASGNNIIDGKVLSVEPISSTASESTKTTDSTSSDVSFTVKIQLINQNDKVKVGMNAVVNIITNEKNDIYSVPYEAVSKKEGQNYVCAAIKEEKGYIVKEIPVTKGIESAINTEIEGDGLSNGMIILSDPSSYSEGSNVVITEPIKGKMR